MQIFLIIVKSIQALLSLLITILLVVPQNFEFALETIKLNATPPVIRIELQHTWCNKPDLNEYPYPKTINFTKPEIKFPEEETRMYWMLTTFKCMERANGSFSQENCLCWDSYYIITVIIFGAIIAVVSMWDTGSYAMGAEIQWPSYFEGLSLCTCYSVMGLIWIILGSVLIHFTMNKWPYVYELEHDQKNFKNFLLVPDTYKATIGFCYLLAIVLIFEGIWSLGHAGKQQTLTIHKLEKKDDEEQSSGVSQKETVNAHDLDKERKKKRKKRRKMKEQRKKGKEYESTSTSET